MQIRERNRKK